MESHESTRQRAEALESKTDEDRIAGKGFTSMTQKNGAYVFPMPQVMKIPDAKAAVEQEWKVLETIPAWDGQEDGVPKAGPKQAAAVRVPNLRVCEHLAGDGTRKGGRAN